MLHLPDSITTWELQVITFSATTGNNNSLGGPGTFFSFSLKTFPSFDPPGFCVAEPSDIKAFKETFVSLRLPYSVRKYEQLSIAPVIYNYGYRTTQVGIADVDGKWRGRGLKSVSSAPL